MILAENRCLLRDHLLAPVDKLAIFGVNGRARHFAIARQQSQHIDEGFVATTEPGLDQLAPIAALAQGFDGLGELDGLAIGYRGTLFGLVQAGALRGIGGKDRRSQQAEQEGTKEDLGNRPGGVLSARR